MNLDSFLAPQLRVASAERTAVKSVPASTEPQQPSVTEGERANRPAENGTQQRVVDAPVSTTPPPSATEVTRDEAPNDIVIEYQSQPKRLYRVNGVEVPSVTTVLDLLNKGGLTIWGQRVGIQGVLSLFEQGALTSGLDWTNDREYVVVPQGEDTIPADVPSIEALMKEHKLTTNDVKDSAADRGTNVHDALEQWAKTGALPRAHEFPESEVGYVEGLVKFLEDANPEPVRQEVMVGSVEHGYAGRYDLELRFNETRKVRKTPKQKWHEVEAGMYLADLKSSRGIYPSTHFRQLAAYEGARIECGYEPTDGQYILNVNGEGSYAFVKSTAVLDDFLAVLSVYKSDKRMAA